MPRFILAALMIVISSAVLEIARHDIDITHFSVGQTPVTRYAKVGADGPVVVVAHGFAGSQQMMQGYSLPLARAGYQVFAFEFLGHGRHPQPMSGDVSSVDGTTRLLVMQTADVIDAVAEGTQPVALIGHSMATDILVRAAAPRTDIGPVVLISAFSQEIDAQSPSNLLFVTGVWEPGLRRFALASLRMVNPTASEGETVVNGAVRRRAVVAPMSDHVSVLQSRVGRREALVWLDQAYGRTSDIVILPTGWAILALLAGLVVIFHPISRLLPVQTITKQTLSLKQTATVLFVPAIVSPVCAVTFKPNFLPVLVADYLVIHLLIFGTLQLALLWFWRVPVGKISWASLGALLAACAVFGFALDRYVANFLPTNGRLFIILIMMFGAIPYMVADAILTAQQKFLARLCARASFLASLALAVALDFENLFFLILIAPVLILFYLVFGKMGRDASNRAGPLSSGLALGVVLAWALGVSFPLLDA